MNRKSITKQKKASTMQGNIVSTELDLGSQNGLAISDKNANGHRTQPSIDRNLSAQPNQSIPSNPNPQEVKKSIVFEYWDNQKKTDIQDHEIH